MGLEEARAAVDNYQPDSIPATDGDAAPVGDVAPDSSVAPQAEAILDLTKAEKFRLDGKEMTLDDLRKDMLRQKDYTKRAQAVAEERRKFQEERDTWVREKEQTERFESNIKIDIQNVLTDPSLEAKFREIYPEKYHQALEQALVQAFGDKDSPNRGQSLLEQRLKSIEEKFSQQDTDRQKSAFEAEVAHNSEILDSAMARFGEKYPMADEDAVLYRAEYMASSIKKDENFNDNFIKVMESLYKKSNDFHTGRYQSHYKEKVEKQKNANSRGKDIGQGGATPGSAPDKMKLRDVKNHILKTMGIEN